MDDPRPTSDLVEDVRAAFLAPNGGYEKRRKGHAALDALVARVTDLEAQVRDSENWSQRYFTVRGQKEAAEAQVAAWLAWSGGNYPDDSPGDVISHEADGTVVLDDGITTWNPLRALAAAEAQVAALTQERDRWDSIACERMIRAEAAEAALATTRQALTEIADAEWSSLHANEELANVQEFARRALAATEAAS